MRASFCFLLTILFLLNGCTGSDSFRKGQNVPNSDAQSTSDSEKDKGNGKGFGGIITPVIDSVLFPREKDLVAGDLIKITGSNFLEGATVTVGGISCTPVTLVDSNHLNCTMSQNLPGYPGVVIVTNPNGLQGNYTYTPPAAPPAAGAPAAPSYAKVLGQTTLNNNLHAGLGGLTLPKHSIIAGGKLWLADSGNNRIAVWNTVPISNGTAPNFALGQTSLNGVSGNFGGVTASSLLSPNHISSDGTKLVVTDLNNHRVLIWNSLPTASGTAADVVIGQPNMSSNTKVNGGSPSSRNLDGPRAAFYNGGKFLVADTYQNRVLIWNSIPTSNYQAADLVLGQPNMTSSTVNNGGVSASSLNLPCGVWTDGTKVFVADTSNNRVLIWNTFPTTNGQAADAVLGQADFVTRIAAVSSTSLSGPRDVHSDGSKLYVADYNNHRVLVWNSIPSTIQAAADLAVGQASLNTNTAATTQSGIQQPDSMFSDGTKLLIPTNNRLLIWSAIPAASGVNANLVVGQLDFVKSTANEPLLAATNSQIFGAPRQLHSNGQKLAVVDQPHNRILIWNSLPSTDNQAADVVVGQANMTIGSGGLTNSKLASPWGVHLTGQKLIVGDEGNHRVLIWNSIPTTDGQAADVVLGQANMTSNTANSGGISASSLKGPAGVFSDGTKLFVADRQNNRILIWNTIPISNTTPANLVLGQPDMLSNTANNGGVSAASLNAPDAVWSDGTRIVVSDTSNNRVLIWKTFPVANGTAADLELGQPDFVSTLANNEGGATPVGTETSKTMNFPGGVYFDGAKLYVSDTYNQRILVWNSMPAVSQQAADAVLGAGSFTNNQKPNQAAGSFDGLNLLHAGVWSNGSVTFVSDCSNNRIVSFP